ncbi:transposase domain-containing protein [Parabacteroides distasonis]
MKGWETSVTIIETAKIHGLEVWDYLVYVFREIMNENKDCSTYAPEAFLA